MSSVGAGLLGSAITGLCCTGNNTNQGQTVKVSFCDIALLVGALACMILGSLWVAGIISGGNHQGVILPGLSFGATVEGSFAIIVGAIALCVFFGRIFSPRFRNCTN